MISDMPLDSMPLFRFGPRDVIGAKKGPILLRPS